MKMLIHSTAWKLKKIFFELLRVRDVDFEKKILSIRNKKPEGNAAAYRSVPIHDEILPTLERQCAGKDSDDPVFVHVDRFHIGRRMQRLCKRAGVTHRRYHGLRHTFISHLLQSGVSIYQVMQVAGHRRIETTQRYLHQVAGLADLSKLKF